VSVVLGVVGGGATDGAGGGGTIGLEVVVGKWTGGNVGGGTGTVFTGVVVADVEIAVAVVVEIRIGSLDDVAETCDLVASEETVAVVGGPAEVETAVVVWRPSQTTSPQMLTITATTAIATRISVARDSIGSVGPIFMARHMAAATTNPPMIKGHA